MPFRVVTSVLIASLLITGCPVLLDPIPAGQSHINLANLLPLRQQG